MLERRSQYTGEIGWHDADAPEVLLLCFRCGSQIPDGIPACPNCGQRFQEEKQVNLAALQGRLQAFERKQRAFSPPLQLEEAGIALEPGSLFASRYEVLEPIGKASLGAVFRVRDRERAEDLALKVFPGRLFRDEAAKQEFLGQVRQVRRLSQKNLVRIHDEGIAEGRPYYAMQQFEGMSLQKIVSLRRSRDSLFELQEIEPILGLISQALQFAHRQGSHGCLKPEDILVLPDVVQILDFGVASTFDLEQMVLSLEAAGTLPYLSPEQRRGGRPDPRSDIFAIGVILCEMLAGVRELGAGKLSDRNPALPPAIDKLIQRAMAEDPAERYRNIEELSEDLTSLIDTGRIIGQEDLGGSQNPLLTPPPLPMPSDLEDGEDTPPPRSRTERTAEIRTPGGEAREPSRPVALESEDDLMLEQAIEIDAPLELVRSAAPRSQAEQPGPGTPPGSQQEPSVLFDDGLLDAWESPAIEPAASRTHGGIDPRRSLQSERSWWGVALIALLILAVIAGATYLFLQYQGSRPRTPTVIAGAVESPAAGKELRPAQPGPGTAAEQPAPPAAGGTSGASGPPDRATPTLPERQKPPAAGQPAVAPVAPPAGQGPGTPAIPGRTARDDAAPPTAAAVPATSSRQAGAPVATAPEARAALWDRGVVLGMTGPVQQQPVRSEVSWPQPLSPPPVVAAPGPPAGPSALPSLQQPAAVPGVPAAGPAPAPAPAPVFAPAPGSPKSEGTLLALAPATPQAIIPPEAPRPTQCPPGMSKINKGQFTMGARAQDRNRGFEELARPVETDAYCIDLYEFPNRAGALPTVNVDLTGARKLCSALGKRLCDDREWEKACKGPKGTEYPYGAAFDPEACATQDRHEEARPVGPAGSFKKCRSGFGIYDLSGNVAEWTESGAIRGGSAQKADYSVRCVSLNKKGAQSRDATTGFRCCKDAH